MLYITNRYRGTLVKLLIHLFILVAVLTANNVAASQHDEYLHAYHRVLDNAPTDQQELASFLEQSSVLTESNPKAQIYVALLYSMVEHPTEFERYITVPGDVAEQVKLSHPSLFYRHKILEAYNLGIGDDWPSAFRTIEDVIAFSVDTDEELYLDAVLAKTKFLARIGLIRASLNEVSNVLHQLPSLSNKLYFGDGAIQNAELHIGMSMSYLGGYDKAIALCKSAETYFEARPLGSPQRYFQLAMDCQRRAYEGLGQYSETQNILDRYIDYAKKIEDWDSYSYGLVLKLQHFFENGKESAANDLITKTEDFVAALPESYDKLTYDIARLKSLISEGRLKSAEQLSTAINARLLKVPNSEQLNASFKASQAKLFELTGQLKSSIKALRESKNYYQSLYYQTDNRKEHYSDYYESALAERKLQLLAQEHELSELKLSSSNKLNTAFLYGIVLLILALIVISYLFIVQSKLKKEQEKLATTDPLTGIRNRRSLLSAVDIEVEKAKTFQHGLSLALIDLDYFKKVNDEHGHDYGDELLRKFSYYVSGAIRKTDVFGRYGGEEFLVCLPMTTSAEAEKILNNILSGYRKLLISTNISQQTFSAGITELKGGEQTPSLIRQCDKAMYQAKSNGRGRIQIYTK